jgi:NADPH2:quinone reductase
VHAWQFDEFGNYSQVLQWREAPTPQPGKGQALLKVHAASINFPDLLLIAGKYQFKPAFPATPGIEAVGTVEALGEGCAAQVGEKLMAFATGGGAFAEYMLIEQGKYFPVPTALADREAAAMLTTYQTSYVALVNRAGLKAGETLLVHGGAGGVGTAAIQLGKYLGARIIATAGSEEKLEVCRREGADHVINYTQDDFVAAVKDITNGRGADVIYDPVGSDVFDKSSKCIAWEGRLLVIGFAGGRIPEIAANRILLKNMSVIGLFWGNYLVHNPGLMLEVHAKLMALYQHGAIKPVIYSTLPMSRLPEGLAALESRKAYGKIVLVNDAG